MVLYNTAAFVSCAMVATAENIQKCCCPLKIEFLWFRLQYMLNEGS